jgi:hypothetical protein
VSNIDEKILTEGVFRSFVKIFNRRTKTLTRQVRKIEKTNMKKLWFERVLALISFQQLSLYKPADNGC